MPQTAAGRPVRIDLRSDTVSLPTGEMRAAMAAAEVGDDVYGDDPSVRRLEERTAEVLGKDAAVFTPTGTMSNQIAIRCQTEPGDLVLAERRAHAYLVESGGPAALSGATVVGLEGARGIFSAEQVRAAVRTPHPMVPDACYPVARLLAAENTHNGAGGAVWPLDVLQDVADTARGLGLGTHLDGARLWHATAATGIPESRYAGGFDTVSVCFSKGLGAPMGSCLAGPAPLIRRARRFRQLFGGGFRQAGIVAAGALHALEHHRERLAEDHRRARRLAAGLCELPGIAVDVDGVETNIVRFRTPGMNAFRLAEGLLDRGGRGAAGDAGRHAGHSAPGNLRRGRRGGARRLRRGPERRSGVGLAGLREPRGRAGLERRPPAGTRWPQGQRPAPVACPQRPSRSRGITGPAWLTRTGRTDPIPAGFRGPKRSRNVLPSAAR